jgi:four helix bundle protein
MEGRVETQEGYERLSVWQNAMTLVDGLYDVSEHWPSSETFGLVLQARRAAVSVPANIAEGHGRSGPREYLHHLSIANGSLCEVQTLLRIAHRRRFVSDDELTRLLRATTEVSRPLKGLIRKLRETAKASPH